MAEIASMFVRVGADVDNFTRGMNQVQQRVGDVQKSVSAMTVAVGTAVGNLATAGIAKLGQMASSVVTTGVEFNALKEQADIAFTTMLGSGEKAKVFLDDLQRFAAKTPFEFPDLLQSSQRLLAMGFSAEEILPTMTSIGDAVAALGGNAETINRVTTAFGQMNAKGKASAEEMMQLTEAGIPAWEFLAQKIGVDIPEAMKMVSKGAVSADTTIAAVTEGINARFGGMMAKQSATFNGLWSTIKDTFTQVSGKVMGPFFNLLQKGLGRVVDWTSSDAFTAGIESFTNQIQKLFDSFSRGVLAFEDGSGIIMRVLVTLGMGEDMAQKIGEAFWFFAQLMKDVWRVVGGVFGKLADGIQWLTMLFTVNWMIFEKENLDKIDGIVSGWDYMAAMFQTLWQTILKVLERALPVLWEQLLAWGKALWQWIVDNAPVALQKLGEWAKSLWGWLVANLPTWIANLWEWAKATWAWIVEVTPFALQKLGEWATALITYLGANLPGWIVTFLGWGTALWTWIGQALPNAINALANFLATLRGEGSNGTSGFWAMVGEWAKALWRWIVDIALPQIAPAFAEFLQAMSTAGENIWNALKKLGVEFGKTLWWWIAEVIPATLTAIGQWGAALWKWLVDNGPNWFSTLDEWGRGAWGWIEKNIGPVAEQLGRLANEFVTWKDVVIGSVLALGILFAPTIAAALGGALTAIGAFVAAWAPVLAIFAAAIAAVVLVRNAWERDWGGIQTKTKEVFDYLSGVFGPLLETIKQFGGQALAEIVAWATGNETNFAAVGKIWESAKTAFSTIFTDIGNKLVEWGELAWEWFKNKFPNASEAIIGAVNSIKRNFEEFWNALQPLIQKFKDEWQKARENWEANSGMIGEALGRLKKFMDNMWAIIVEAASLAINNLINVLTLIVQLINGDWRGAWDTAKEIVRDTWNALTSIVRHGVNAVLSLFGTSIDGLRDWYERTVEWLKDWWEAFKRWIVGRDWYQYGRDIVQGLWNGMKSVWDGFMNWWSGVWGKDLTKTVKVEMKTKSPSKVMEKLGGYVMEGFGIGAEKWLPYVEDVMGQIPATSMAAGQGAYMPAGAGASQPAVSTSRIEELLLILINELRAKNMTANVTVAGGGSDIATINTFLAGSRI